tara:strand:- start:232 stop:1017 length:786 start_codon:yes stop_codon:yes gene_type:complete
MLRKLFELNDLRKIDIDSPERIDIHRNIINSKPIMKEVFTEIHNLFLSLDKKYFSAYGDQIELGAGAFPIKETHQNVISSDVVEGKYIDIVLDALNMNLKSSSVRSLFAQNVFHHFSDPEKFFDEANRVLALNGGIIILDPYYGLASSLTYPYISPNETFNKKQKTWISDHVGPMRGANQALSYIIFKRDKEIFNKKYPNFEIVYQGTLNNYLRYFLSGGLNFKQLIPTFMSTPTKILEIILTPIERLFALHHIIVIKKCN